MIDIPENITLEYIDANCDKLEALDWENISKKDNLDIRIIEKYIGKLNTSYIIKNQTIALDEVFFEKYYNYFSPIELLRHRDISEAFVRRHLQVLGITNILEGFKCSEPFLENLATSIQHWRMISGLQKLSEEFIEKHRDDIFWEYLKDYDFSMEFIRKYCFALKRARFNFNWKFYNIDEKIEIHSLMKSNFYTQKFIDSHIECLTKKDWELISKRFNFTLNSFKKYKNYINIATYSRFGRVKDDIIRKYKDDLCWLGLSRNNISESILRDEELKNKIHWDTYFTYHLFQLSKIIDILEAHLSEIKLQSLCLVPNIPEDFFEKNIKSFDFEQLISRKSFSVGFYKRNIKYLEGLSNDIKYYSSLGMFRNLNNPEKEEIIALIRICR